jgi:ATP-dependent RNA helicase DHX36
VDSGLVRENHWDAEKSMSSMLTVPTSKASATQRLGRAGRVAPGKCYRLYSMGQYEAMLERPLPEIQRSALEATCLNTCSMTNDKVATFLSRALDPPKEEAVKYSMERLKKLGAISVDSRSTDAVETLTPLGNCLSQLPLDPAIGRMLIMGCVMQCLDPILTAAACFSSRDVFFTPPGFRDSQRKIRREFCEHSDTLAAVRAYEEYNDVLQDEGWDVARQWASDNFISISAMASVHSIRLQLINELHRIGLVHHSDLEKSRGRNKTLRADATLNRNSGVESLYSAVWACSSPDNLAARQKLGSFGTLRTRMEDRTGLHPSSVTFHRKPPANSHRLPPWFSYREMVLSSQVFLRGCTALTPEQILLFGGYSFDGNQRLIDEWIMVEGQCADTLDVLSAARREINAALELTVMNPRKPLPEVQRLIVDAVCDCFDVLDETD